MDYLNRGICFFVLLFWPVTIAMQRICGKKSAIKNIILGLITLFIVTNLESLSATMGFVASGLVYLFFLTTKGRFIWLLKAGVLFALLAVPFLSYKISPKAIEVAYPALPETAVHRLYIWDFVAKKAAEKPFFGWGFNSSRAIPGGNESYVAKGTKGKDLLPLHPHNQLLQIWLELGIIGLGIFAWLLLYCIKSIENGNFSIATKSAGLALFSAYFVIGLFGFGIWQNWWLAAGFFALCLFVAASYSESLKKASAKAKN